MSRKLCNTLQINGDIEAYKLDAMADSPGAEFLDGTPLLQAIVDDPSPEVLAKLEPTVPVVASVMAFTIGNWASTASSNQRWNCIMGSGATSLSSSDSLAYS